MSNRDRITYTVRLSRVGGFPMDMLRSDCSWPESASDAAMIETLLHSDDREIDKLPKSVDIRLTTDRKFSPEVGRWESFGIRVMNDT